MTRPRPARDALAAHLGGHGLTPSTLAGITNPNPAASDAAALHAAVSALAARYGVGPLTREVAGRWPVTWSESQPLPPAARTADPSTSHAAAASVTGTPTARNHMGRLLLAFLRDERASEAQERGDEAAGVPDDVRPQYSRGALTSEEAAAMTLPRPLTGAEFAKRCSDLQALGYLQVAKDADGHERTRQGRSGRQRLVFELTPAGRALAEGIEVVAL